MYIKQEKEGGNIITKQLNSIWKFCSKIHGMALCLDENESRKGLRNGSWVKGVYG